MDPNLVTPNLAMVCLTALFFVFALLTILALTMKAITAVFPQLQPTTDAALVAAISGTVAALVPGARVTKIEEV